MGEIRGGRPTQLNSWGGEINLEIRNRRMLVCVAVAFFDFIGEKDFHSRRERERTRGIQRIFPKSFL